jgi:hypothetical protein
MQHSRSRLLLQPEEDPVPVRNRRRDIPAGLAAIIHKALSREVKERFPHVKEMQNALSAFCP